MVRSLVFHCNSEDKVTEQCSIDSQISVNLVQVSDEGPHDSEDSGFTLHSSSNDGEYDNSTQTTTDDKNALTDHDKSDAFADIKEVIEKNSEKSEGSSSDHTDADFSKVIKLTNSNKKPNLKWTNDMERALVNLYEDCKNDNLWPGPRAKHTAAQIWRRIAVTLSKKFKMTIEITGKQCKDKWGHLFKRYQGLAKEFRSGSANNESVIIKARFPLFSAFERILGSSDLVEPAVQITCVVPGTDREIVKCDGSIKLDKKNQIRTLQEPRP
jgi:hypothetical protein